MTDSWALGYGHHPALSLSKGERKAFFNGLLDPKWSR
jgi:hypothetical protein